MIDKKADTETLNQLLDQMVHKKQFKTLQEHMNDYDDKFKTISVFASELANILLPDKLSSKF